LAHCASAAAGAIITNRLTDKAVIVRSEARAAYRVAEQGCAVSVRYQTGGCILPRPILGELHHQYVGI